MYSVILLSNDSKVIKAFQDYFKGNAFYNVVITDNVNNININDYDILVIDYDMYIKYDYIFMNNEVNIKTFLLVSNKKETLPIFKNYNLIYSLYKPLCMEYFEELLNEILSNYNNDMDLFRYEIIRLFKEIGLSFKLFGTRYLYDLLIEHLCYKMNVSIKMYDFLAYKYNKSFNSVEKNIRYALKTCFDDGKTDEKRYQVFGYCYKGDAISNLSFIYNIVPEIRFNLNNKKLTYK